MPELGREFSATLGTAIGDHLAAANRRHAGAKAMPALADKFGRLIGPFHDMNSGEKQNKT
jgi:hypothetical protein